MKTGDIVRNFALSISFMLIFLVFLQLPGYAAALEAPLGPMLLFIDSLRTGLLLVGVGICGIAAIVWIVMLLFGRYDDGKD